MTRDASLDEFLGGNDEDAEPGDDGNEPGDGAIDDGATGDDVAGDDVAAAPETDDAATPTDVERETDADEMVVANGDAAAPLPPDAVGPATSTYDWSPDGDDCAACSATVERRWRDDPGLVCADCKEW